MNIGFTGTQRGMTVKQQDAFEIEICSLLFASDYDCIFHHGVCIGADEEAHFLVYNCGLDWRYLYPPINTDKMSDKILNDGYSFVKSSDPSSVPAIKIHEPKDYLERNKDIVNASDVLIVVPGEFTEQLRSGTWSTYRYAKKKSVPRIIIFPDGTVKEEK